MDLLSLLMLLSVLTSALAAYALVRSIIDFREGRKILGSLGLLLTGAIIVTLLIPYQTHAVKIDLPRN